MHGVKSAAENTTVLQCYVSKRNLSLKLFLVKIKDKAMVV